MKTIISISLFLISFQVFANAATVLIEPLYGFEKYYRLSPAPAKFKTRTMLGIRASYGVPLLSAELEVTTGEDSENSPTETITKSVNKREQAKLGLRSNYALGSLVHLFFRAGARAAKDTVSIIQSAITTTTIGDVNIDPYLGAGVRVIVGANFSLNAGVTGTQIKDDNGDAKIELQTSFSASIKAGKF